MKVSLVMTLLNEERSLRLLLDSVVAQTRPPDEVVIVDGGSQDDTMRLAESFKDRLHLRLLSVPGANISRGRNMAIAEARGEIIACTDGGVRLHADWLSKLVKPFETCPETDVVAGFFQADVYTDFELAMGATVLPVVDEIAPERFLPSSRSVAFRKDAWLKVGGYPEWLDYCEDVIFDLALRRLGLGFAWAPEAVVYFRPRSNLRSFFLQYYHYARGDGKANLWQRRHAIRYGSYAAGVGLLAAGFQWPAFWALLAIGTIGYLQRPYRRLWRSLAGLAFRRRLGALLLVPVIRVTGDIAKMLGYPVGLRWRRRNFHGQ